jgi:hypothetical protein
MFMGENHDQNTLPYFHAHPCVQYHLHGQIC